MRILLCTHPFSPQVGGLETVARLLAKAFQDAGHEVRVCTRTAGAPADDLGITVVRNPSGSEFGRQAAWADVVLHNNISLPWAWPLILRRKPWVCGQHNWPRGADGSLDWMNRLKRRVALMAPAQTAVSKALAAQLLGHPEVVGNPYDDAFFRETPGVVRDRDFVFLGRLVSDKGIDTLVRAFGSVLAKRPSATLSIIGTGPELESTQTLVNELKLSSSITFFGALHEDELIAAMNRHKICVVPSRGRESFGLVVLEAAACGCVVIGSNCGGIPEAVGEGGPIFPIDDNQILSELMSGLVSSEAEWQTQRVRQDARLHQFTAPVVAQRYLDIFERITKC